jgi:hypothetical protein
MDAERFEQLTDTAFRATTVNVYAAPLSRRRRPQSTPPLVETVFAPGLAVTS